LNKGNNSVVSGRYEISAALVIKKRLPEKKIFGIDVRFVKKDNKIIAENLPVLELAG
jgi:hypothetical protein